METHATERAHIPELHAENLTWLKEASFYKEELEHFTKQLSGIANNYTDTTFQKQVGHFESQFRIQANVLDELKHNINQNEKTLAAEVEANPVAYERRLVTDHAELRGQYKMFLKLYGELKTEFHAFLAKYL